MVKKLKKRRKKMEKIGKIMKTNENKRKQTPPQYWVLASRSGISPACFLGFAPKPIGENMEMECSSINLTIMRLSQQKSWIQ